MAAIFKLEPKYQLNASTGEIVNSHNGKPIPEDEPIIILRAQDDCVLNGLEHYYRMCESRNAPTKHLESIRERINEFRMWQRANHDKVKVPD